MKPLPLQVKLVIPAIGASPEITAIFKSEPPIDPVPPPKQSERDAQHISEELFGGGRETTSLDSEDPDGDEFFDAPAQEPKEWVAINDSFLKSTVTNPALVCQVGMFLFQHFSEHCCYAACLEEKTNTWVIVCIPAEIPQDLIIFEDDRELKHTKKDTWFKQHQDRLKTHLCTQIQWQPGSSAVTKGKALLRLSYTPKPSKVPTQKSLGTRQGYENKARLLGGLAIAAIALGAVVAIATPLEVELFAFLGGAFWGVLPHWAVATIGAGLVMMLCALASYVWEKKALEFKPVESLGPAEDLDPSTLIDDPLITLYAGLRALWLPHFEGNRQIVADLDAPVKGADGSSPGGLTRLQKDVDRVECWRGNSRLDLRC